MEDVIKGKFGVTLFRNDDTSYTIRRFKLYDEEDKLMTVTGYLPVLEADRLYRLYGMYVEHPKYGMQFRVERYERVQLDDRESLVQFFSGSAFAGIGKKTAERIVEVLGEQAVDRIEADSSCLDAVQGMNAKKKAAILQGLAESRDETEELLRYFTLHGLNMRQAIKVQATYGQDILEKLQTNPYRMVDEVDGIGFATADAFAASLGFAKDHPYRIQAACVSFVMEACMKSGSSYISIDAFEALVSQRLAGIDFNLDEVLCELGRSRRVMVEDERVYPISQYDAEVFISQYFSLFPASSMEKPKEEALQGQMEAIEAEYGITYAHQQLEAIRKFFEEDVMILTGGPGTGKTTIVRAMVTLCKRLYATASIALAAPTGRAAKRLSELTGHEATTIHSLLRWDLDTNSFGKNAEDPLTLDVLIVDEFSMVDQYLFYHLLLAGTNIRKLVLIGDEDQLPSVACGCVLKDMLESGCFPVIRLSHIFRQKQGSDIIALAQDIRENRCVDVPSGQEVKFFPCHAYQVKDYVLQIVQEALQRGYDLSSIQVLAPKYVGIAGIDTLNNALQKACNPPRFDKRQLKVGYRLFREGDKILQLKNDPDQEVYNGDIGILIEIVPADENDTGKPRMLVDFDGILAEYGPETFHHITHAYCISVHKSQGSEYPIVIMPVVREYGIMLRKRLLYTGITRAGSSLVLLGEPDAFLRGIHTEDQPGRKTTLCERIRYEEYRER